MKIVDVQVTPFQVRRRPFHNGTLLPETTAVQTLTRVATDDGAEGYYLGGHGHGDHDGLTGDERTLLEGHIRSLVLGPDSFAGEPDPGRASHVDWDLRVCRAVRERVGEDMVLMYDPWGTYRTYEEAIKVGRVLEELGFYWYEHPMPEYRGEAYVRLCRELSIPILGPEIAAGSIYTRADWIQRGASDMSRIDVLRGGITGCHKMAAICE